nr:ferrous iron transporter B [Desulfurococcales archaeon]
MHHASHGAAAAEAGEKLSWIAREASACGRLYVLIGSPNTGKSTLFNVLTGGRARVGNWPGVTVDVSIARSREGYCLIDLPGVYGLGSTTLEERVTMEAFFRLKPDGVIVVLDATVPEKSLYLLVSAVEALDGRVAIAVTKARLAHGMGVHVDAEGLARELGVPLVVTSALEGVGIDELRRLLTRGWSARATLRVDYGLAEEAVERLASHPGLVEFAREAGVTARWLAAQLLAGDDFVAAALEEAGLGGLVEEAERLAGELREKTGLEPQLLVAQARVRLAERLARSYVVRRKPREAPGWLDRLFRHPVLGPLASVGLVFLIFLTAFSVNLGFPLNVILSHWMPGAAGALEEFSLGGLIAALFEWVKGAVTAALPPGPLAGAVGAAIDGVGLVASFIPLVATVTAMLALIEDVGLLTRVAVALHPIMSRFGLTGRSVYPLGLAMGCNVPAIISTRILEPAEKLRAALSIPFIVCSARFLVITLFVSAFFHGALQQALAATGIYATSFAVALVTARLVAKWQARRFSGVEEKPSLVIELPPLHGPSLRVIWWSTREALGEFLKKMGGPILVGAFIIWGLLHAGPGGYTDDPRLSAGYYVGAAIGQLFRPIGVGDHYWVLGLSALAGAVVKEVFAETIGIAMGTPDPSR